MALSSLSIVSANPTLHAKCSVDSIAPLLRSSFLPAGSHMSNCRALVRYDCFAVGGKRRSVGLRMTRGRRNLGTRALFGLGVPELVVIAGVTALIFGPKKLPEIGKSLGKTVKSFQQAAKEFESEVKQGDSVSAEPSKQDVLSGSSEREKENMEQ